MKSLGFSADITLRPLQLEVMFLGLKIGKHRVGIVSRGQTLSRRALSIRDDKRPRRKGLVQVQYQTRSLTPSPSRGVNGVLIDIALKSSINTTGTWLNV